MKQQKQQTVEKPKDEPGERHPSQADDMTPTATYPVLTPRKAVTITQPESDTEPHVHIRGLQRLPRRQRKPGWRRRRLAMGVLLVTLMLVLLCWGEVAFIPETARLIPSSCTAVGGPYRDASGMDAQLALCRGRYILFVQQADGVSAQQAVGVWTLHVLSPKKSVYEAQVALYFADQTAVVVGLERQGTGKTPRIVWEHVS